MTHDDSKYQGRYLGLIERDGWEFVTRTNASGVVVLIPVTPEGAIVFVEQYRVPVGNKVIELPAGLVGDEDDALETRSAAAHRELLEETGFRAGTLHELVTCPSSAGMSDEMITFFLAEDLERVNEGGGDASEDITVHVVARQDVDRFLATAQKDGKAFDPKVYAALYWLDKREQLSLILAGAKDLPGKH